MPEASAARIASALGKRPAGSLARARVIAEATTGGTSGRHAVTSGIGAVWWAAATAGADGPSYGGAPASISNSTTPTA